MSILAVVPVRAGSRGVPNKWAQLVDGKPLLLHTLETLKESGVPDRLVVSTESQDIAAFCRLRGFEVLPRPAHLAEDDVPLSEVAKHATEALSWLGWVLLLQPTCPLLTKETIVSFTERFRQGKLAWAISSTPADHLVWHEGRCLQPRVNRQGLPRSTQVETGALQMMTADYARLPHGDTGIIEIPSSEALDIDTHADLAAARLEAGRRMVHFHVAASQLVGTGHFWRCLQLSHALSHHHVTWSFAGVQPEWTKPLLEHRNLRVLFNPSAWSDLIVVDCLDVAEQVVPQWKADGHDIVLFEHDGPAARYADLVVDEFADPKWAILRPEFVGLPTKVRTDSDGYRILVSFGGSDPAGLNRHVGSLLSSALGDARVRVAAGPATELLDKVGRAEVLRDCSMAAEMRWADVVVTSQGRTVVEAAACGTPCVSLAANERESRHAKLPGVVYLGLWASVSDYALTRTVQRLLDRPSLRAEMAETASAAVDGRGLDRVVHSIEGLLRGLT